jgi:Resolvase, N terminal domain
MPSKAAVFVSYLRVSTAKQGAKGLGMEAQRAAVETFAAQEGAPIAAEYVEVETGKGSDALDRRPQLAAALAHARRLKAPVAVAKLCRLGRDAHFISGLMKSGAVPGGRDGAERRPLHVAHLRQPRREGTRPDQRPDQGGPCSGQARLPQARHGRQRRDGSPHTGSQVRAEGPDRAHHRDDISNWPQGVLILQR